MKRGESFLILFLCVPLRTPRLCGKFFSAMRKRACSVLMMREFTAETRSSQRNAEKIKHYLFFWFLLLSGYAWGAVITTNVPGEYFDTVNNNVSRSIMFTVTVSGGVVQAVVGAPTASASVVSGVTGVADVSVKGDVVTMSVANIQKAGSLLVPVVITASGNQGATPAGYQVIWSLLSQILDARMMSTHFFQLQMVPISGGTAATLYSDILYGSSPTDKWLNSSAQGVTLSQAWTTNNILQMTTNNSSTITFSFQIPYTSLVNLPDGVYWMNTFAIMSPQSTNTTLVANQIAILTGLIDQGNTLITGNNSTNFPTTAQIATIRANQVYLADLITQIIKANTSSS